jgi:hypothetical protein
MLVTVVPKSSIQAAMWASRSACTLRRESRGRATPTDELPLAAVSLAGPLRTRTRCSTWLSERHEPAPRRPAAAGEVIVSVATAEAAGITTDQLERRAVTIRGRIEPIEVVVLPRPDKNVLPNEHMPAPAPADSRASRNFGQARLVPIRPRSIRMRSSPTPSARRPVRWQGQILSLSRYACIPPVTHSFIPRDGAVRRPCQDWQLTVQ